MTEEEMLAQLALAKQAQVDKEALKTVGGHLYRGFAVPGAVGEDIGQVLPSIVKNGLNLGMRGSNALLGTQLQPFEPTQWRTPAAVQALLQGGSGAPTTTALAPRPDEHDRTAVPSPAPTPAGPPSWIVNMPGTGGGGGRPTQVAAPGAVSQADAYDTKLEKILSAAELAKAKDRSNMDATLRGLPADKLMDRLAMFERMNKDTPLPERAKRTFMDNMRDQAIHGFTGPGGQLNLQGLAANTTAQKVAEDARMKDATQERMRSILEQVGMKALDTGDVNKSQDKKNAITLELAKNGATFDKDLTTMQQRGLEFGATQGQAREFHNDLVKHQQALLDQRGNESRKQKQEQEQEIALAVIAGRKNPGAPGTLTPEQGAQLLANVKFGLKPRAEEQPHINQIEPTQKVFEQMAGAHLKGNPEAQAIIASYSNNIAKAILNKRPPGEALQEVLDIMRREHPVRK